MRRTPDRRRSAAAPRVLALACGVAAACGSLLARDAADARGAADARDAAPAAAILPAEAPPAPGPAAFVSTRHPDTADTRGPYPILFRQLAGPPAVAGRLIYSVLGAGGPSATEPGVVLRRGRDAGTWVGEIPGQAAGSAVAYHAVFSSAAGGESRHPARAPAEYRFRVTASSVLSVRAPSAAELARGRSAVEMRVGASSPPVAELVARLADEDPGSLADRRIPFQVVRREGTGGPAAIYVLRASLPDPAPGGIVDFYVELRDAGGGSSRCPPDAPARAYSVKRSMRSLSRLDPGRAFVLGLGAMDGARFIGLSGGGLWLALGDGTLRRLGAEAGVASGLARLVLPDPAIGRVFVGTDSGVVEIGADPSSWLPVGPPRSNSWSPAPPAWGRAAWRQRAGPGALSTLDGTLLVQIQGEDPGGRRTAEAELLVLRDGRLERRPLPAPDVPLAGLSAALFDPIDGCFVLGGFVRQGGQGMRPAVMRSCGDAPRVMALRDPPAGDRPVTLQRIVALARDPASGSPVVALDMLTADAAQPEDGSRPGDGSDRRTVRGIFRLDMETGRLAPLAPGADALDVEVTGLATDWTTGRILVGTFGRGLLSAAQDGLRPLAPQAGGGGIRPGAPGTPREITALRVEEAIGTVLVGTSSGAFEISAGRDRWLPIGPAGDGPLLADALPADADAGSGRVLLSSHQDGLVELKRDARGSWSIARHWRPGRDFPEGGAGDARYAPGGGLVAVLESRGLVLIEKDGKAAVLGPGDGLQGPYVQRVLARRDGDIWAVHLPLPFGADARSSLQMIHAGRVARTVEIAGREAATVARWLEVPGRDSVFAATRAGVLEIRADGTWERRSTDAASSIARDPVSGTIGVVGARVERWDEARLQPVLFSLRHPRRARGKPGAASPIDLAIDGRGIWHVLYPGGVIALLRPDAGAADILDPEDGVPPTAVRLLADPRTGDVFVGSDGEGVAIVGATVGGTLTSCRGCVIIRASTASRRPGTHSGRTP
ncbi:MAG TPA: hypothetical protein VGV60_05310 [Candidatus Polarisedimenticolia bacterium]|nr:hypothetical protein [Candidatus Polarisedimenticolia bacterium]